MIELDQLADAIAERVLAGLNGAKPASSLVDAATLAAELGTSPRFVYEHADELGAMRLGSGPKARLRFDLEAARAALACSAGKRSQAETASDGGRSAPRRPRVRRGMPNQLPKPGSVLKVRGVA